jgi:hypothetical protein
MLFANLCLSTAIACAGDRTGRIIVLGLAPPSGGAAQRAGGTPERGKLHTRSAIRGRQEKLSIVGQSSADRRKIQEYLSFVESTPTGAVFVAELRARPEDMKICRGWINKYHYEWDTVTLTLGTVPDYPVKVGNKIVKIPARWPQVLAHELGHGNEFHRRNVWALHDYPIAPAISDYENPVIAEGWGGPPHAIVP